MKQSLISIIGLILILSGCSLTPDFQKNQAEQNNFIKEVSSEEENLSTPIQFKKIKWSEDIVFKKCEQPEEHRPKIALELEEKYFTEKTLKLVDSKEGNYHGEFFEIEEYCISDDETKLIFIGSVGKGHPKIYRYDREKEVVEEAHLLAPTIEWPFRMMYYRDSKLEPFLRAIRDSEFSQEGFQKRNGSIIPIKFLNRVIAGTSLHGRESEILGSKLLKKEANKEYCDSPGQFSDAAICLADVYYDYDFVENTLTEQKACTFYIDEQGKKQVLEKCVLFETKKNTETFDRTA